MQDLLSATDVKLNFTAYNKVTCQIDSHHQLLTDFDLTLAFKANQMPQLVKYIYLTRVLNVYFIFSVFNFFFTVLFPSYDVLTPVGPLLAPCWPVVVTIINIPKMRQLQKNRLPITFQHEGS